MVVKLPKSGDVYLSGWNRVVLDPSAAGILKEVFTRIDGFVHALLQCSCNSNASFRTALNYVIRRVFACHSILLTFVFLGSFQGQENCEHNANNKKENAQDYKPQTHPPAALLMKVHGAAYRANA